MIRPILRMMVPLTLVVLAPLAGVHAAEAEPEALIRQGIELRRKGDDARAHGYFKRAYDLARTPRSAAQLGLVEQALGQFLDAEQHLTEAMSTKDAWVQANRASLDSSRAYVRAKLGKVEIAGAPADATVAIGTDPATPLPRDGVVWILPARPRFRSPPPAVRASPRR